MSRKRERDLAPSASQKRQKPLARYHPFVERVRRLADELTGESYSQADMDEMSKCIEAAMKIAQEKCAPGPFPLPFRDVEGWLLAGTTCPVEPTPEEVQEYFESVWRSNASEGYEDLFELDDHDVLELINLGTWMEEHIVWKPASSVVCVT